MKSKMKEICGYSLDEHGLVTDCGKFEREPAYIPYLWLEHFMNGFEDESFESGGVYFSIYFVNQELLEQFPDLLLDEDYVIILRESESGFVTHTVLTKDDYDEFVNNCEDSEEIEE